MEKINLEKYYDMALSMSSVPTNKRDTAQLEKNAQSDMRENTN